MDEVKESIRLDQMMLQNVQEVWTNDAGHFFLFHRTKDLDYVGGYHDGMDPFVVSRDKLMKFHDLVNIGVL